MNLCSGRCRTLWMGVLALLALAGCDPERKLAANNELSGGLWSLLPRSPAFREGRSIPSKYAVDGENLSPPLAWGAGPSGTREFVLIVEDADTDAKVPAVHWIVYNIPGTARGLPEAASLDDRLLQGKNYKGTLGYTGPGPESKPHHYYFELFALNAPLNLLAGATRAMVIEAMDGIEIAKGELVGVYGK